MYSHSETLPTLGSCTRKLKKNLRGLNVTSLDTFTFNEDIVEMESRYEIFSLIKKDCRGE